MESVGLSLLFYEGLAVVWGGGERGRQDPSYVNKRKILLSLEVVSELLKTLWVVGGVHMSRNFFAR